MHYMLLYVYYSRFFVYCSRLQSSLVLGPGGGEVEVGLAKVAGGGGPGTESSLGKSTWVLKSFKFC